MNFVLENVSVIYNNIQAPGKIPCFISNFLNFRHCIWITVIEWTCVRKMLKNCLLVFFNFSRFPSVSIRSIAILVPFIHYCVLSTNSFLLQTDYTYFVYFLCKTIWIVNCFFFYIQRLLFMAYISVWIEEWAYNENLLCKLAHTSKYAFVYEPFYTIQWYHVIRRWETRFVE